MSDDKYCLECLHSFSVYDFHDDEMYYDDTEPSTCAPSATPAIALARKYNLEPLSKRELKQIIREERARLAALDRARATQ